MPTSPTGRYCDSPPRSPRAYDKFSYALKRKPEGKGDEWTPRRAEMYRGSAYEACVAGVAPLMTNADGFAVAEDGTVQSRFVSAPRFSAPSIAMVPVPMAVYPGSPLTGTRHQLRRVMSPSDPMQALVIPPIPYSLGVSEIVPNSEVEAWKRLVMVAGRDFREAELGELSWETLSDLLVHYNIRSPIDIARIQLAWKRRQGLLPSDSDAPAVPAGNGYVFVAQQSVVRYPNASPSRSTVLGASPRRDSPSRYVPEHKVRKNYDHVSPKVDTGRRTPTRTQTPTRR